jgi:hypothetical protein
MGAAESQDTTVFRAAAHATDSTQSLASALTSLIEQGDPNAAEQLLPLVYDELCRLAAQKLAQEKTGQVLQATALVHEAYARLVQGERDQHWDSRRHFFVKTETRSYGGGTAARNN